MQARATGDMAAAMAAAQGKQHVLPYNSLFRMEWFKWILNQTPHGEMTWSLF